jgi:hypothetical protein
MVKKTKTTILLIINLEILSQASPSPKSLALLLNVSRFMARKFIYPSMAMGNYPPLLHPASRLHNPNPFNFPSPLHPKWTLNDAPPPPILSPHP